MPPQIPPSPSLPAVFTLFKAVHYPLPLPPARLPFPSPSAPRSLQSGRAPSVPPPWPGAALQRCRGRVREHCPCEWSERRLPPGNEPEAGRVKCGANRFGSGPRRWSGRWPHKGYVGRGVADPENVAPEMGLEHLAVEVEGWKSIPTCVRSLRVIESEGQPCLRQRCLKARNAR